jgi:PAS domain S-box-containing protein
MNKTYVDFIGKPAEQIMGRPIVEVIGEAAFQTIRPYVERVLAGERVEYETEIPDAMKVPHRMHVVYAPDVDSQGTVIGWIGTLNDITDRRRAEQKLREKEQFLAMLAHELRNPLTPISAGVELLQHTVDAQLFQSTLSLLGDQVAHMKRLLDDLLDVSRVTLGKVELKLESLDVRAVVEQAVQTARALLENGDHSVTLALPREPLYVRADAVRLAQVLGNLLSNACKYTDSGGSIAITAERVRDQAFISVRDQGIGFASEDAPRMFELFAQLDTSRQRSVGGLGVGLTLAKAVVEKHGGTLEARSEGLGHGSEFVVSLPIATEKPEQREAPQIASDLAVQRRVLIIDDMPAITLALTRLLHLQGHVTRVAHDGLNGLQAAQEFRPEIVLLDIGLPNLDGYDTCRRIRSGPGGKDMVLVALSGYGQAVDVKEARAAGFDHYLLKPVRYQALAQIVAGERCDDDKMAVTPNEAS